MLLEFEWVGVGALVSADGVHKKEHGLNFHLNFHQDTWIHHLHLKKTFGDRAQGHELDSTLQQLSHVCCPLTFRNDSWLD